MSKKLNSNLYTETIIKFDRNGKDFAGSFYYDTLEDGCLFSKLKYKTKIKPEDLPEWYVKGRYYKNFGYMNAKGVKYLVYEPNYHFNHLFKYDWLNVSYDKPIVLEERENLFGFGEKKFEYTGYDYSIEGTYIIEFIEAVVKYSDVDVNDIIDELIKKINWFVKEYPDELRWGGGIKRYHKEIEKLKSLKK